MIPFLRLGKIDLTADTPSQELVKSTSPMLAWGDQRVYATRQCNNLMSLVILTDPSLGRARAGIAVLARRLQDQCLRPRLHLRAVTKTRGLQNQGLQTTNCLENLTTAMYEHAPQLRILGQPKHSLMGVDGMVLANLGQSQSPLKPTLGSRQPKRMRMDPSNSICPSALGRRSLHHHRIHHAQTIPNRDPLGSQRAGTIQIHQLERGTTGPQMDLLPLGHRRALTCMDFLLNPNSLSHHLPL